MLVVMVAMKVVMVVVVADGGDIGGVGGDYYVDGGDADGGDGGGDHGGGDGDGGAQSAAPATKSAPQSPQSCACHEICTSNSTKCRAGNEICL